MSKPRDYWDYLRDIQQAISDIEDFTDGLTFDHFKKDRKTVYAVIRALEICGEAVKKIPASLRKKFNIIPWKEIAGMRDVLIHEYFGVNTKTLWKTVKDDIPFIKPLIKDLLNNTEQKKLL